MSNSGVWDQDYGWGVPFGARDEVCTDGTRLGDLKNKQPTHTVLYENDYKRRKERQGVKRFSGKHIFSRHGIYLHSVLFRA